MSLLETLPACGGPAVKRIEIFVPDAETGKIADCYASVFACGEHAETVQSAATDAKLIPYLIGQGEGRCGDGMDYTVRPSRRLVAPRPGPSARDAKKKRRKKKATEKADKPVWWKHKPCPPWCANYHDASDGPADRFHLTRYELVQQIPLSQLDPKPSGGEWLPQMLMVDIEQHVDAVEPVVKVAIDEGRALFVLTLSEVEQVREALRQVTALARGAA